MKKTILSLSLILIFGAYVLHVRIVGTNAPVALTPQQNKLKVDAPVLDQNPIVPPPKTEVATTVIPPTPKPTPPPPPPPPVQTPKGMYKDGSYLGSSEYAYSDYIQVTAIIKNGKLTDVQYPSTTGGPGRSRQIYAYAMPQLAYEAISAQNANVDSISGASYTSQAFAQSLDTALQNAKS